GEKSTVTGVPNISVAWTDMGDKVSKYFTVGDNLKNDPARIPTDDKVKDNIKIIMSALDTINDRWAEKNGRRSGDKVIMVSSGFRPESINAAQGGVSGSQHTQGAAVDIFPTVGTLPELQAWLDKNWSGALGYGAAKGFVHLDIRQYTGKFPDKPGNIRWDY
ncbi:MAG: D-Ala-D-Ala carboxypeptidase family metallohydrolase, partial [Waterburya sp.]